MRGLDGDKRLIDKALKGSERAWRRLVMRYEKQVYNQALRLSGNRADALDLTQDVFIAVYRNLPNYRADGAFGAWLNRIAANRANDHLRSRQRQPQHTVEELEHIPGGTTPDDSIQFSQRNREILNMLGQLSADQRLVVELKFFQQHTFEEIAQQLGISSNTAKTRLYGAIRKLQQHAEVFHAL
jgi:RNA polymerase sigma-70 factor (ECF subfamily)